MSNLPFLWAAVDLNVTLREVHAGFNYFGFQVLLRYDAIGNNQWESRYCCRYCSRQRESHHAKRKRRSRRLTPILLRVLTQLIKPQNIFLRNLNLEEFLLVSHDIISLWMPYKENRGITHQKGLITNYLCGLLVGHSFSVLSHGSFGSEIKRI